MSSWRRDLLYFTVGLLSGKSISEHARIPGHLFRRGIRGISDPQLGAPAAYSPRGPIRAAVFTHRQTVQASWRSNQPSLPQSGTILALQSCRCDHRLGLSSGSSIHTPYMGQHRPLDSTQSQQLLGRHRSSEMTYLTEGNHDRQKGYFIQHEGNTTQPGPRVAHVNSTTCGTRQPSNPP